MSKPKAKPDPNLPATIDKPSTAPKGIDIADLIHYRVVKKLSHAEIAKIVGCCEQNVQQRLAEAELETVANFNTSKDSVFEHLQHRTLKNIGDDEIKSMSVIQRVTAAAILEDKIRNIRQQSTGVIDVRHLTVDLNKAIDQLRAEQQLDTFDTVDAEVVDCPTSNAL
jgi:hypothetical protein